MRFKDYLVEYKELDLDKFAEDCHFYIEEAKQAKQFHKIMWHGTKAFDFHWDIIGFKPRSEPRNTPFVAHTEFNRFFERRFGWPFRNGLFTTSNEYGAVGYGRPFAIFPIGKFEWLCNPNPIYSDLTGAYIDFKKAEDLEDKDNSATVLFMDKLKHTKDWKHNVDLDKCLNSESEIMIKCEKFYAVREHAPELDDIKRLLK